MTIHRNIIIIGGGAAGLMAAITAPGSLVLEKMPRPARKMMITGKGRCNFSNVKPWQEFSEHIHPKANFIRPAFYNLTPEKLIGMFQAAGLSCVVERGQRAFPESHKAVDVVDTLVRMARLAGSDISCDCAVTSVEKTSDGFVLGTSKGIRYSCDKLIITCGGLSYPTTGSDGDGYAFAKALGHHCTRLYPSLTALVPKGYKAPESEGSSIFQDCQSGNDILKKRIPREMPLGKIGKEFMGRSMKNVTLSLYIDKQMVQSEFGDIDFTDGGLEGPLGFKISRRGVIAIENGSKVAVEISFKDGSRPIMLDIEGYVGYERCVVTAGGISTDDILGKTMESRLVPGLYFAGEVLDIDADTGGYNLHCAYATGYLAGQSAAK